MSGEFATLPAAGLPAGTHTIVEVAGREVGVFNVRGRFYALPNVCFHQNGPLCRGLVSGTLVASEETGWQREWVQEGEIVTCPWHLLEFDVTTGRCVNYPERRLPLYRIEREGGELRVFAHR